METQGPQGNIFYSLAYFAIPLHPLRLILFETNIQKIRLLLYLTISKRYLFLWKLLTYYETNWDSEMNTLFGNDELLLLAILSLKDDAYGATILKHLTKITGKEWSIGAIYDPLYRLEKNGYVRSMLSMPTRERGGRSKRVYRVTKTGLNALREHQEVRNALSTGLPNFAVEG